MTELEKVRRLMALLRANVPQLGLLSIEVLLLCAEGPKTSLELCARTGAANGPVMRACWPFVTRQPREGKVIQAQLPLIKRMKRQGARAPVYMLSVNGWRLLRECELL